MVPPSVSMRAARFSVVTVTVSRKALSAISTPIMSRGNRRNEPKTVIMTNKTVNYGTATPSPLLSPVLDSRPICVVSRTRNGVSTTMCSTPETIVVPLVLGSTVRFVVIIRVILRIAELTQTLKALGSNYRDTSGHTVGQRKTVMALKTIMAVIVMAIPSVLVPIIGLAVSIVVVL